MKDFVRAAVETDLFISVITLGELARGIGLLDEGGRKTALAEWLQTLESRFSDRILPIDPETGLIWGEITARCQRSGRTLPAADGLIAATGLRHGLHVATRNMGDFEGTGVLLFNPWN